MNQGFQEPIERDEELEELERLSNGVLDLIDAGRLEDAERACGVDSIAREPVPILG